MRYWCVVGVHEPNACLPSPQDLSPPASCPRQSRDGGLEFGTWLARLPFPHPLALPPAVNMLIGVLVGYVVGRFCIVKQSLGVFVACTAVGNYCNLSLGLLPARHAPSFFRCFQCLPPNTPPHNPGHFCCPDPNPSGVPFNSSRSLCVV